VSARYFQPLSLNQRIAHERLTRICFIDYDREMALVAERKNAKGEPEIIAVQRLSKLHGLNAAEFAVVIIDEAQHQGLGSELMRRSLEVAKAEKMNRVICKILTDNQDMQAIARKLGFTFQSPKNDVVVGEKEL
jgi:acetyltransferase